MKEEGLSRTHERGGSAGHMKGEGLRGIHEKGKAQRDTLKGEGSVDTWKSKGLGFIQEQGKSSVGHR